jgi:signal transduction histidine kinase/CheY-like chemotaxis protein
VSTRSPIPAFRRDAAAILLAAAWLVIPIAGAATDATEVTVSPPPVEIAVPAIVEADRAGRDGPGYVLSAAVPELGHGRSWYPEAAAVAVILLLVVASSLFLTRRGHQVGIAAASFLRRAAGRGRGREDLPGPAPVVSQEEASDHERMVRACSRQLAYLGHELRMPVTAAVGMADILGRAELAPEHRRCVETILNSCEALTAVVDSFLDFSSIQSGSLVLEATDFDLQQLVDEVLDMMSHPAGVKGLELAAVVASDVPLSLNGDPARLRQVLVNLLGNAVKYTEEGHVFLRVSCRRPRAGRPLVRFDVCDTGCGVSRSEKSCIFDAFVRADPPGGHLRSGVGLGLYIARMLVEQMGGEIGLDGATGLGSTFWFTARFEQQARPRHAPRDSRSDDLDAAALIVDRSSLGRRVLTRYAEDLGLRAVAVDDADVALAAVREAVATRAPYDLLFLDARMRGYDLLRITEAIREDERIPTPELVLLTSLGDQPDSLIAALVGRHAELAKPITRSRFSQLVRDLLKSRRGQTLEPLPPAISRIQEREIVDRSSPGADASRPLRILVAEDNPVVLEAVSRMLRDVGCEVDTAADGHVAIRAARENDYDAIFMDFQMPGLDGCEATRAIRRFDENAHLTPIIGLTAHAPEDMRERCRRAGMADFLVKPVRSKQLMAALSQHCRPRARATTGDRRADPPAAAGNPAAVDRLRLLFLEDSRTRLDGMRVAAVDGDLDTVAREAHALIGSARMVGAERMSGACQALETAARTDGEAADTLPALRDVETAFERLRNRFEGDTCRPANRRAPIDADQPAAPGTVSA